MIIGQLKSLKHVNIISIMQLNIVSSYICTNKILYVGNAGGKNLEKNSCQYVLI